MGILGKGFYGLWHTNWHYFSTVAVRNFEVMQGRGRNPVDMTGIILLTRW
jgi:hypothetical protein